MELAKGSKSFWFAGRGDLAGSPSTPNAYALHLVTIDTPQGLSGDLGYSMSPRHPSRATNGLPELG